MFHLMFQRQPKGLLVPETTKARSSQCADHHASSLGDIVSLSRWVGSDLLTAKKSQLPDGRCHPAGEGAYIAGRGGAGAGVMCFLTAGAPGPPAPRAVVFAR